MICATFLGIHAVPPVKRLCTSFPGCEASQPNGQGYARQHRVCSEVSSLPAKLRGRVCQHGHVLLEKIYLRIESRYCYALEAHI